MVSEDSSIARCAKSVTKNGDWLNSGRQNINSTREARVSGMDEIIASLDAYSYSPELNSNRTPALFVGNLQPNPGIDRAKQSG
jgi:hypothetical protein